MLSVTPSHHMVPLSHTHTHPQTHSTEVNLVDKRCDEYAKRAPNKWASVSITPLSLSLLLSCLGLWPLVSSAIHLNIDLKFNLKCTPGIRHANRETERTNRKREEKKNNGIKWCPWPIYSCTIHASAPSTDKSFFCSHICTWATSKVLVSLRFLFFFV